MNTTQAMPSMQRQIALLVMIFLMGFAANALAQQPPLANPALASSNAKQASPIQTQFKAFKVNFLANGQEELEPASSVSPGDVVAYVAVHRNVSGRRLLNTDFAIPIPYGTTLWQGSVQPAGGKLVLGAPDGNAVKSKDRPRVVWRVDRLDPGQSVELKLRVSIDPDSALAPARPRNPFAPQTPQLRQP
jgi:hypothetical protein